MTRVQALIPRWRDRSVHVLRCYRGKVAEQIRTQILELAKQYPAEEDYRAFPGPNSNTFVEWLCLHVPALHVDLPSSAYGKDYAQWLTPRSRWQRLWCRD